MTRFDPRFHERDPLFWPIAGAAAAFAEERDWPAVESYERAFERERAASVRFVRDDGPARRRGAGVDTARLYDARITREGCVPTRERSWHDFLNALVWATFPRAKRLLHERQHRVLQARIPAGARTLPSTRSREHDAIALIDEGGAVVIDDGRESSVVLFGHAIYEGLVLGRGPATACGVRVEVDAMPSRREQVERTERELLQLLAKEELDPSHLSRVPISAGGVQPTSAGH